MLNRRRRREKYILDVKVNTGGRTRQQVKWLAAVVTAVAVVGFLCFGGYRTAHFVMNRLMYENPRFAIVQIAIRSDGVLTPSQIVRLAGVQVGQNLLAVDLESVRRNLEMLPIVKQVEVRRELPNRLHINVSERVAVARLRAPSRQLSDGVYYIDRTGVVMKPIKLTDGTVLQPQTVGSVPVLTGVALGDVRVGRQAESEQIYRALDLIDRLAQSAAGSMFEVDQIDLSKTHNLTLLTRQRTVVKFDVEEFTTQLRRLSTILAWAQQRQKIVQSVDLTVARGVPVSFAD